MISLAKPILTLALLVLGEVLMAETSHGAGSIQSVHKLNKNVELTLNYLLYLPPGYESKTGWPLILFLHGSGESGSDI